MRASTRFRQLLAEPGMAIVPGAYDAISAKMVEQSGYPAVLLAGGAYTGFHFGLPDSGFITQTELVEAARQICAAVDVPLILDFDDAGGTPLQAFRGVQLAEQVGTAAFLIEDMVSSSKQLWREDWHPSQLTLRSIPEMTAIISAAADARKDPDTVIVARSDAYQCGGFAELRTRLQAYSAAGADMLYPCGYPALSIPELQAEAPGQYLMYASHNPSLSERAELEAAGVKVLMVIHTVNGAIAGFQDSLNRLERGQLLVGETHEANGGWYEAITDATESKVWANRAARYQAMITENA